MKETGRLSLFVQVPFHASLNDWFVSMKKSELYSVNAFKFDADIFPLLLQAKPCLILTSILDEASKTACLRFLHEFRQYRVSQGYPARDPALRIVVIAKNRQAASTNWPELGVYELMIAPVPTNVLTYKLSRHHQKALSAENQKSTLKLLEEHKMTEVIRGESPVKEPEWKVFQVPQSLPSPEVRRIEALTNESSGRRIQKIEIEAKLPQIQPAEGEWVPADEVSGYGQKWEWKPNDASLPSLGMSRATFWGEKPVYQTGRQSWQFTGEEPRLKDASSDEMTSAKDLFRTTMGPDRKPSVQARASIEVHSAKQKVYLDSSENEDEEVEANDRSHQRSLPPIEKSTSEKPILEGRALSTGALLNKESTETAPPPSLRNSTESQMKQMNRSGVSESSSSSASHSPTKTNVDPSARFGEIQPSETLRKSSSPEVKDNSSGSSPSSVEKNREFKINPRPQPTSTGGSEAGAAQDSATRAMRDFASTPSSEAGGLQSSKSAFPSTSTSSADIHRAGAKERSQDLKKEPFPSEEVSGSSALPQAQAIDALLQSQVNAGHIRAEDEALGDSTSSSHEEKVSASDSISSALDALHGQRHFDEGSFSSPSSDESYSTTTIRADEEESFWSILYDEDEREGARNQKKKPASELQGWNLKLLKKSSPLQSRLIQREAKEGTRLARAPKETLFERILRFIRQFFNLS